MQKQLVIFLWMIFAHLDTSTLVVASRIFRSSHALDLKSVLFHVAMNSGDIISVE